MTLSYIAQQRLERALDDFRNEKVKRALADYIPDKHKSMPLVFYGGNLEFIEDETKERVLSGPAETGKTMACLFYLNQCAWAYPGMQGAIIRNVRQDLFGSALVTFHTKILPVNPVNNPESVVRAYGGEKPEKYIYPNGSVLWVGGLDKPGGALSSERDIIYINQAEEISETARNKLLTRVTGRAGVMPNAQLIYDCNPNDPDLWIMRLYLAGKLKMFQSRHKDNPTLYQVDYKTGEITDQLTEQGEITMSTLNQLTGVDKQRLLDGLWVRATGLIYGDEWLDSSDGNVTEAADYIPDGGELFWSIDDGYAGEIGENGHYTITSHPRAFILAQLRPNGDLCIFQEDLRVKTLSDVHISEVVKLSNQKGYPMPEFVSVDKSAAELRGRLFAEGFYTRKSPASVDESIKELRRWVAPDQNKRRRLLVHPRCKHLRYEFLHYRKDDKGKIIKAHDHALDALRYLVWAIRFRYDD